MKGLFSPPERKATWKNDSTISLFFKRRREGLRNLSPLTAQEMEFSLPVSPPSFLPGVIGKAFFWMSSYVCSRTAKPLVILFSGLLRPGLFPNPPISPFIPRQTFERKLFGDAPPFKIPSFLPKPCFLARPPPPNPSRLKGLFS